MKNKISSVYAASVFVESNADPVYMADFTERTNSLRKIEIHDVPPPCPSNAGQTMDCLVIHNPNTQPLLFNLFDDNQFKDENGHDLTHCECCFFPSQKDKEHWLALVEIKDCKPSNISQYKAKAKHQIISTAELFKKHQIIQPNRSLYGIVSFPRRNKTDFNDFILGDIIEQKQLKKTTGITFIASNQIIIKENKINKL